MTNTKQAALLLAHGSPDTPAEVAEFLKNVTGGRGVPPAVVKEVEHRYTLIGHSPLTEITLKQAAGAARELGLPVYVGMRNWKPFVQDTLKQLAGDGITQAVAICLAPQNSRTSVGLYKKALFGEGGAQPHPVPPKEGGTRVGQPGGTRVGQPDSAGTEIDFVESWHDHPLLIRAFAEKLQAGWQRACRRLRATVPVIFTAHSVPARTIEEGDPYEQQARETAALVAMEVPSLSVDDWTFAFQSQGMSGGKWLGPTVEETIVRLKKKGHRGVFVQPIGFVCDHVEVLYDIDIAFKEFAEKEGMRLWRAESLNDSPLFCAALADVARSRLKQPGKPKRSLVQIQGKGLTTD